MSMPERRHLIASAVVVLLLALLPLAGSRYAIDVATEVLIYVLFALSLNVLIGFTGNVSFGHAAYFAIGGYACAILLTTYGWPLLLALPAAVVLAGMVAAVVGYFCVRLTQIYFAMLTLAFAMLVWGVAFKWKEVTGGDDGFTGIKTAGNARPSHGYFYFTLAVGGRGHRRPLGDLPFGVRPHPGRGAREQRAGGLHRRRHAPHALGGLHRGRHVRRARRRPVRHVPPRHVHRERLLDRIGQVLIMVLLGGIYSFVGPIIGAAVLHLLQTFTNQYTTYWPTVLGLILLVIVMVLPDGLIGLASTRQGAPEGSTVMTAMLHIAGLWKSFAGFVATRDVSFDLLGRRDPCRHRPQRRRQDHLLQPHHRPSAGPTGQRVVRGPRPGRPAAAEDRAAGHRPLVPAHQHLSPPHRVRERPGGADRP